MSNFDTSNSRALTELAKRIRDARINARLSQAELAKGIGVSDKSISAYEQGRSTPPFEKLKKIADQTHYPIAYFMQDENADIDIANKLASIERELTEVKRLLKKSSQ